ncbi:MAG: hypothetical protein Q8P67_01155, partial [archaeon]|nr:hypothetical protein [archaeon]
MAASSDQTLFVHIAVNVPTLSLTKKFTFLPTEIIAAVITKVSKDLGFPTVESFGLLNSGTGRWCDSHATLVESGFTPSTDPTLRHACELKVRKGSESDAALNATILNCIPSDRHAQPYVIVTLSASQPPDKSIIMGLSKGTTVGTLLVLLKSHPATQPQGFSKEEIDTFGLQAKILDKSDGSHRLTLSLAESTVFGENAFDGSLPLSFCRVKVCCQVHAFFNAVDFHSPPSEISISLDALSPVSFLMQKLLIYSNQPSSANTGILETMMYLPSQPTFKNCGVLLSPASALSSYGYLLALRCATRERLEGTVGMTANTIWVTIHCSAINPPLRVEALLDTNISFNDVINLFWSTHPGRQLPLDFSVWTTPAGKKGSGKSSRVPKLKKIGDPTLRLRELGLTSGSTIELRLIGKLKFSSTSSTSLPSSGSLSTVASGSGLTSGASDAAISKLLAVKSGPMLHDSYGLFGIELSAFPFSAVQLPGGSTQVSVPALLLLLKESLDSTYGLSVDGIFRQGGTEHLVKSVSEKLVANTFDPKTDPRDRIENVHSLAALLKRWIGALPEPLFGSLTLADFKASSPSTMLDKIPQPLRDISRWLIWFLAETASYSRFNR